MELARIQTTLKSLLKDITTAIADAKRAALQQVGDTDYELKHNHNGAWITVAEKNKPSAGYDLSVHVQRVDGGVQVTVYPYLHEADEYLDQVFVAFGEWEPPSVMDMLP